MAVATQAPTGRKGAGVEDAVTDRVAPAEAVEAAVHAEATGQGKPKGKGGGGGGVDKAAVIARVIELVEDWHRTQAERLGR